jgi:hypothetical protein
LLKQRDQEYRQAVPVVGWLKILCLACLSTTLEEKRSGQRRNVYIHGGKKTENIMGHKYKLCDS